MVNSFGQNETRHWAIQKELYLGDVIRIDCEFVFSAALAASFNHLINRTVDTRAVFVKVSTSFNVPSQPAITNRYELPIF
ncbi:hypothetical protein B5V00_04345 [Geothermobacter hydrogeniphilus]|uniref:Uncharacterized protein n=1 Tax=Geothermobacter hydrogeniphilus TaxID=1969733 RepID=A0A1X0YBB6_9BACT|nr:hypothetical protein B5V00_04345 [Geothermobacter hydrogeniphilus]